MNSLEKLVFKILNELETSEDWRAEVNFRKKQEVLKECTSIQELIQYYQKNTDYKNTKLVTVKHRKLEKTWDAAAKKAKSLSQSDEREKSEILVGTIQRYLNHENLWQGRGSKKLCLMAGMNMVREQLETTDKKADFRELRRARKELEESWKSIKGQLDKQLIEKIDLRESLKWKHEEMKMRGSEQSQSSMNVPSELRKENKRLAEELRKLRTQYGKSPGTEENLKGAGTNTSWNTEKSLQSVSNSSQERDPKHSSPETIGPNKDNKDGFGIWNNFVLPMISAYNNVAGRNHPSSVQSSLGIGLKGRMSVVIEKNTPIPTNKTMTFRKLDDGQTELLIEIFEGDSDYTSNNHKLGEIILDELPLLSEVKIIMRFEVNRGSLTVTAGCEISEQVNCGQVSGRLRQCAPFRETTGAKEPKVVHSPIGVKLVGDKMLTMVKQHEAIPVEKRISLVTVKDNQSAMHIPVYAGGNENVNLTLRGFPPLPEGQIPVYVKFTVDENGILAVTARCEITKDIKSFNIGQASIGSSTKDMEDLQQVSAREGAKIYVNEIKKSVSHGGKIFDDVTPRQRKLMLSACDEFLECLRKNVGGDVIEKKWLKVDEIWKSIQDHGNEKKIKTDREKMK